MFEPNGVETSDEKIAKALTKRKGVCIHYAEVFNSVANKSGIKTYIIPGYTKQFGKVAPISHAWCISKVDGKWFVFDPTWGAGYLEGKKYVKKMNNTFFKADPAKMINSHMPFDYLWQLLNEPVTNQEFISGKPDAAKPKMNFDFAAEIENYDKLSDSEKAFQASQRIEKNGLLNNLILDFYDSKKKEFTVLNQNKSVDKLNAVSDLLNETISYLNDFILFRNRKFKPKQSDETLQKMMQDIKDKMKKCQEDVYKVGQVSSENATMYNQLKRHILETSDKVKEQENFLNEYLSKGSLGRKLMFTNLR
jgi:transglutaminase/protease-like cytokinesis protein 3